MKNIATFFGIPLTEEELQLVVERSSFQSMKKNSEKTHGALGKMLFRKGRELQVAQRWKCHIIKNLGHALVLFLALVLAFQVRMKQVITALLEKTMQGEVVRKRASKALPAEPLLEADPWLAGRRDCRVCEFLSTSVPGSPSAQPLENYLSRQHWAKLTLSGVTTLFRRVQESSEMATAQCLFTLTC